MCRKLSDCLKEGYTGNETEELFLCPSCGNDSTHHGKIEIFEHSSDDYKTHGLTTIVEGLDTTVQWGTEGNPSARRNGLRIHGWCESCDKLFAIELHQHKGQTFIDTKITGERKE